MKSDPVDPLQHFDVVTVTLNPAIDRTVTIPNFTAGVVNRVGETHSHPGGKGVNVASALADYGCCVAVTGFLGRENASSFDELFAGKNIGDFFVRIAGQTRACIKIADPVRHQTTDINFSGPAPGPADLETLLRQLDALDADCFVLAGSVPPGLDPAIYGQMISRLRSRGRRVVVDTSGEPLRHAIKARPCVIKPNIHELEALVGKSLPDTQAVIEAARRLNAGGIELVAVSIGGEGSCFVTADAVVTARPPHVEAGSTVGAGDAMVAGIVAARLGGLPLTECAQLATAFSVDVLMRGTPGFTSRASVQALMQQVVTTG